MSERTGGKDAALSAERVSLRRGHRLVIDTVDCTVAPGTLTAVVGPNGAGKSTLLHLIAGIDAPDAGVIAVSGDDVRALGRRERARRIALVEQQAETDVDLSVWDVVMLGRTPHLPFLGTLGDDDARVVQRALDSVGIAEFAERGFRELSGGERQRVLIARALAQEPELLLMDEPTNHLDVRAQLETIALMRALARSGIAVVAALHDLNLAARNADSVIVLDRGRVIASGRPAAVLTTELIATVYGVHADVLAHPVDGSPVLTFSELG